MSHFKTRSFFILFVFITSSTIAFSQEKVVHLGASFNAKITHQITNELEYEHSENSLSYSAAGNIYFNVGSKFQLISGVNYSHYQLNKIDSESFPDCVSNNGELLKSFYRHDYLINYLGIPLEARWEITGKTNHLFLQFGFEGFLKIKDGAYYTFVSCNKPIEMFLVYDHYYRIVDDILVLSKFGVGYEFQLWKNVKLFFEPNVEYSLTNVFKYEIFKSRIINIGLNTGLKF